jgi:hypothetical protein
MRSVRLTLFCGVFIFFSVSCLSADSFFKSKNLTVLGMLTGEGASGSQTAGWSLTLNPVIMLDGKQLSYLQVKSSDVRRLAALEDKFVEAKGKLTFVSEMDSFEPPVFEVWSIKEHKGKEPKDPRP